MRTMSESHVGQGGNKPSIIVVIRNVKEILDDTQLLFVLAGEPQEFDKLKENMFDVFLIGGTKAKPVEIIDQSRPIVLSGSGAKKGANANDVDLMMSLPIAGQSQFNLYKNVMKDIDYKSPRTPDAQGVFPITSKAGKYFLRYDAATKYSHFGKDRPEVLINKFNFDPLQILGQDDIVVEIDNSRERPEARKQNFDRIRKETLGGIKAKPNEHPDDFNLRKQAIELQFNELERFFVESEKVRISLNTDKATKKTKILVTMTARTGTKLADSIEMMTKVPAFYSTTALPGAVVQKFINFPIDEMRKKHVQDYVKIARPRAKQRILENPKVPQEKRQTDADIAGLMLDVLDGIGSLDSFNAFVSAAPVAGQNDRYAIVGSARLADGTKFYDGLKKLSEREQGKVKLDVEKVGKDLSLHSLQLPNKSAQYPMLFAKDQMLYIATGPKSMWYSSGENALVNLKKAIEQSEATGSKPNDQMIKTDARLLPIVEFIDAYRKANPAPPPPPPPPGTRAPRKPKDPNELRNLALEVFRGAAGTDTAHMSLKRSQPLTVDLEITADEGILKFFGKVGAKFVKEQF